MRSRPECAASDKIPKLPVVTPTPIFSPVMTTAAQTELPATARFSVRICSEGVIAGVTDMLALSLGRTHFVIPSFRHLVIESVRNEQSLRDVAAGRNYHLLFVNEVLR